MPLIPWLIGKGNAIGLKIQVKSSYFLLLLVFFLYIGIEISRFEFEIIKILLLSGLFVIHQYNN